MIAVGTSDYGDLSLPFTTHDVDRIVRLFTRFGYERALPGLERDPGTDVLRREFGRWLRDRHEDDVVVFYFAGHGAKAADDGRHYLLCRDSEFDALASTALATDDLVRLWAEAGEPVAGILFVFDVCYAGAGLRQVEILAKEIAATGRRLDGLWVLAAARARDEAEESLFADAFERAIDTAKAGQRPSHLAIDDLVDAVNADLAARERSQRAVCYPRFTLTLPAFVPNPKFWPDAPAEGVDLATQRRLRRLDLSRHFEPRSRGVERGTDAGDFFTGRTAVLAELTGWLSAPAGDGRARVVTGSPGAGKSAVLGRLVVRSGDRVDLAVHARQLRVDQAVAAIAGELGVAAADPGDVLEALHARPAEQPFVLVVDAVDEAAEPGPIARELLRPMASLPGVRLVAGVRPEYLPSLRPAIVVLDLDRPEYTDTADIADYVTKLLLADELPTPYRSDHALAMAVAAGVAERARHNFLVARMHALRLVYASEPVDVRVPGWHTALRSDIGEVFDEYLSRLGEHADRARRLLTAVAYAEGEGLPWDDIWAPLAAALSGTPCVDEDIAWLLDNASSYVVETTEHDRSTYRLYHQALADHLRRRLPAKEAQRRIVRTLRAEDPFDAHPYVRTHLARHAVAAGMLDQLIADPAFVLAAEKSVLLPVLSEVTTDQGRLIASVVERAASDLPDASQLQLIARRYGANEFADRVPGLTWHVPWADVVPRSAHRVIGHGNVAALDIVTLPEHGDVAVVAFRNGVIALISIENAQVIEQIQLSGAVDLAVEKLADGRDVVFVNDGGRLWRWDVTSFTVTATEIYARSSIAVTTATDGTVVAVVASGSDLQVHDVATARKIRTLQLDRRKVGHGAKFLTGVAAATQNGRTIVVAWHAFRSGPDDCGVLSAWDLATGTWRQLSMRAEFHPGQVVITALHDPPCLAVSDGISLIDCATGARLQSGGVKMLATGTLESGQTAMISDYGVVRLLDDLLGSPAEAVKPRVQQLAGHDGVLTSVAFSRLADGRDVVISAGTDRIIRRWDVRLTADAAHSSLPRPPRVTAVAIHGTHVVSGDSRGELVVRDLADGSTIAGPVRLPGAVARSLQFTDLGDGRQIVAASDHGDLIVWRPDRPDAVTTLPAVGCRAEVVELPDVRRVVVSVDDYGDLSAHDLADGTPLFDPVNTGHGIEPVMRTAVLATSDVVVVVADGVSPLQVRNVGDGRLRGEIGLPGWVFSAGCATLDDGRVVAVIVSPTGFSLVDLDRVSLVGTIEDGEVLNHGVVTTLADGRILLAGLAGYPADALKVWDFRTMALQHTINLPVRANDMAMSVDGTIVLATENGLLTIAV
nr:caspase family protein [Kibdelosporangium phytohabitans]